MKLRVEGAVRRYPRIETLLDVTREVRQSTRRGEITVYATECDRYEETLVDRVQNEYNRRFPRDLVKWVIA